jgi:hypothetical protein
MDTSGKESRRDMRANQAIKKGEEALMRPRVRRRDKQVIDLFD